MERKNKWIEFIEQSFGAVGKYFLGKSISCAIIGVVAGVILHFLDIKGAIWLAILLGIANFIPVIGVWAATIISSIVVLIQTVPEEPFAVLYLIITVIVLQVLDDYFITPLVVGKAIDLKPLMIIGVVWIGGWLFGIPGMIFAAPVAAIIRIGYTVFVKDRDKKSS